MKLYKEHDLACLLVEELRQRRVLEDVISEYGIETVRECGHCHRLMNSGWLFGGYETYCSDECLMAAHPDEDIRRLREEANDNDSDSYWTEWEG